MRASPCGASSRNFSFWRIANQLHGRYRNESAGVRLPAFRSRQSTRKNFSRLSRTRSLVSQSVNPRLRTVSEVFRPSRDAFNSLAPPGLVLKPCTSQSSRASAGASRICRPPARRKFHFALAVAPRVVAGGLRSADFFVPVLAGTGDLSNRKRRPCCRQLRRLIIGIIAAGCSAARV